MLNEVVWYMRKKKGANKMKNATASKAKQYKKLSLSPEKLKEITVSPKIRNGKVMLDKDDPDHRYLYDD
jgi:hypothetical protein